MASGNTTKIRQAEGVLMVAGFVLLALWAALQIHSAIASRMAIARFQSQNTNYPSGSVSAPPVTALILPVDFRLWSAKRISAYETSLTKKTDAPLAILRIPKINLEVPVFNDTDDLTLDRGVGRILGTAQIGQPGNLGIAGHRDGFFRGLQNITGGDIIELVQPRHTDTYVVSKIRIVVPEDTYVLSPTTTRTLTLVTCFPFYFVGHAPKRYIVTALAETALSRLVTENNKVSRDNNIINKEEKR